MSRARKQELDRLTADWVTDLLERKSNDGELTDIEKRRLYVMLGKALQINDLLPAHPHPKALKHNLRQRLEVLGVDVKNAIAKIRAKRTKPKSRMQQIADKHRVT